MREKCRNEGEIKIEFAAGFAAAFLQRRLLERRRRVLLTAAAKIAINLRARAHARFVVVKT